jgi:hypothetical protein
VTYIAGIYSGTAVSYPVYVDSSGPLSAGASSRRYKEDIEDMGDTSSGLMKLRPVTFHYKSEQTKEPRTLQ